MSESKSEMSSSLPVGNLKNRIDNNLKLSIPRTNLSLNGMKNHPSTAPALSGLKNQFGDLKNLMKNWDQDMSEMGEDDYFISTPGSIIGTPSTMKRKHSSPLSIAQRSILSLTDHSPLVSQFMDTSTMSPIMQVS
jgi:hypothetical protein